MPTIDLKKSLSVYKSLRVFSGSSNRPLAEKIAAELGVELAPITLIAAVLAYPRHAV